MGEGADLWWWVTCACLHIVADYSSVAASRYAPRHVRVRQITRDTLDRAWDHDVHSRFEDLLLLFWIETIVLVSFDGSFRRECTLCTFPRSRIRYSDTRWTSVRDSRPTGRHAIKIFPEPLKNKAGSGRSIEESLTLEFLIHSWTNTRIEESL